MSTRKTATYEGLRASFAWTLPAHFNIGWACADRHPTADVALVELPGDGSTREITFGELAQWSNRFANGLSGLGVRAGDRVAVVLPQRAEAGIAHLAVAKLGAVVVPISALSSVHALRWCLGDSGTRVVVTDEQALELVADVAAELEAVTVVVTDAVRPHRSFWELAHAGSPRLEPAVSTPDTPALLLYTPGTTGSLKGTLHAHRVLLGHLPGFELMFDGFPQPGDRVWTPADWARTGGLLAALLPTWYHGRPVVAEPRTTFDPEWAWRLLAEQRVTATFLPPPALELMRRVGGGDGVALRSVTSAGEPLRGETLVWGRERLGVTVNEVYGQTEANLVAGNSAGVWEVRPGSIGRPYPGHEVAVVDDDGAPLPPGELGELAVRAPDPAMFLGYWNQPQATAAKFRGQWLLTGDLGRADGDGWLWFVARADEVVDSAGREERRRHERTANERTANEGTSHQGV